MNWLINLLGGCTEDKYQELEDKVDDISFAYNKLLKKYRTLEKKYKKLTIKTDTKLGNVRLKESTEVKRGRGRPKKNV